MLEPDFAGIDPTRVPEVKRRIGAIEAYLSLPTPSGGGTIRLARSMGLTRFQFQRLVIARREHRDAKMLVVTKRKIASRNYGIDPRDKAIADEVIEAERAGGTARTFDFGGCEHLKLRLPHAGHFRLQAWLDNSPPPTGPKRMKNDF